MVDACTGDPSGYDDCHAVDLDENGQPTALEGAVLHPVSRYIGILAEIEANKRALDPGADVSVLIIGGLGTDGQLHYADVGDTDPEFQNSFGIGPGCEYDGPGGLAQAVPPVRMREVGAALSSESLASICSPSYYDALAGVYSRLLGSCE